MEGRAPARDTLTDDNREVWAQRAINLRESRLRMVMQLILQEPPGTLLDIGCGAGEFSARCRAAGWKVFGLELIETQAAQAGALGIRTVAADVSCGLPYNSDAFDLVFAGELIEHLLDTDGFFVEVHRVLKTRGVLVVTTPNLASLENRLRLLFGFYPEWVDYQLGSSGHVRAYTPPVLRAQLVKHGFLVERHAGNWIPFIPQRFMDDVRYPWLRATGNWWPSLAMAIIMKCRKRP